MSSTALSNLLDTEVDVVDQRPLGGGCISEVSLMTVRSPSGKLGDRLGTHFPSAENVPLVVKRNRAEMVSNFRCEVEGLQAIANTGTVRVPAIFAVDQFDDCAWIVMEWISSRSQGEMQNSDSSMQFREFGRQLAKMHRSTSGKKIGWHSDNFLGSAKQPNGASSSWPEYVAVRRLGYQLRWACDQKLADPSLKSDCESVLANLDELLTGREDATCLLHGDLWSGNYLFDERGSPVLIDPAVYCGCREAEWGMIKWLGNCPPAFEQGYQEEWPMPDGWQRRAAIYLLYHQLNHLNLFGVSYAESCRHTAHQILSEC